MTGVKNMGLGLCMAALLLTSASSMAAVPDDSVEPTAGEMTADLLVARPFGAVATVAGAAVFLVSLPFTMLGGNVAEAGDALVAGPAKSAFVRCLGCVNPGWRSQYEPVKR